MEIARIVGRIREHWPRMRILLRADSGFAREALMGWCEKNRADYVFGLARDPHLIERISNDLAWAEDDAARTGKAARRFADFQWAMRDSWRRRRRVVVKAEWMPSRGESGANPRFIVTSLPAREIDARTLYERVYCAQGDMETGDSLQVVVICPSNPCLSIGPILAVPGSRERLARVDAPVVAVSPILGGKAIKGPLAKILGELGHWPDCAVVARHYAGLVDGFVVDDGDRSELESVQAAGIRGHAAPIVMRSAENQTALAREVLAFAEDSWKLSRFQRLEAVL